MSYAMEYPIAARAGADARGAFIGRTYAHLAGAILAFIGLEALIFGTDVAASLMEGLMAGGRAGLFIVLAAFIGAGYLARMWAHNSPTLGMQYAGLGLYVLAQA